MVLLSASPHRGKYMCMLQVKPILARLKITLAGSTAALLLSAGALVGLVQAGTDADGIYGDDACMLASACIDNLFERMVCYVIQRQWLFPPPIAAACLH